MIIYTNTSSGRKRKSKSKKLAIATEQHRKFLASHGYHGKSTVKIDTMPDLKVEQRAGVAAVSNSIPSNGFRRSVDDWRWKKDRAETSETIKEIERKKKQVAPIWNKGGVMYITEGTDPSTLGRKV